MSEPRVTAIVPVRDGAAYIAEAIESILAQTTPCAEIIVSDDGSTDESAAIADGFEGVRVVRGPAGGIGAARNRAIAASTGEFIAPLDADDLWEPRKTELQLASFASAPETDLVRGETEQFLSPEIDPARSNAEVPEGRAPMITSGAMMWRRSLSDRVGGFDEGLDVGEMLEWILRCRRSGMEELVTGDLLLRRRVHTTNTTIERKGDLGQYAKILKADLDARRARARTD